MSATAALREELAHVGDVAPSCALAELSGALRFGGSVTVTRAGVGFTVESTSGAVLRRVRQLVGRLGGQRVTARVEVHRPAGLHRSTRYRLVLGGEVTPLLRGLGLLDQAGRPVEGVAATRTRSARDAAAYARGALMAAGSVTDPDGPVHLEVRAPGPASADGLARLLARCGGGGARATGRSGPGGVGWRVVVKSGADVAAVLARVGAHGTFLRWEDARLRRELRGEANRAANAVRANVSRAVTASSRHVADIERALATADWDELPAEVTATALARLANPEASLAEVGALLDPPVGKATVHRRLRRLTALRAEDSPATRRGASEEGCEASGQDR